MSLWEKETAGYVLRATPTISGDRSIPRSATGPETVSTNAASDARSSGLPASSSPNSRTYVSATASYDMRVTSRGSTRRTLALSPDHPLTPIIDTMST
jgi:hypothetical protein